MKRSVLRTYRNYLAVSEDGHVSAFEWTAEEVAYFTGAERVEDVHAFMFAAVIAALLPR